MQNKVCFETKINVLAHCRGSQWPSQVPIALLFGIELLCYLLDWGADYINVPWVGSVKDIVLALSS